MRLFGNAIPAGKTAVIVLTVLIIFAAFIAFNDLQTEELETTQVVSPTNNDTTNQTDQPEQQQTAPTTNTTAPEPTKTQEIEPPEEPAEAPQQTTPIEEQEQPSATNSTTEPVEEEPVDLCGNAVGNGNEIVHGQITPNDWNPDNAFRSLTVHPSDPDRVLFGTEANGFVITRDGGQTWERLRMGLRHSEGGGEILYHEIYDIAFSQNDPDIIYAATLNGPGPLTGDYPSSVGGIYKSTDGGQTWSRKNCGLDNGWIFSVYVSSENQNNAIIGVSGGAITFSGYGLEAGHYFGGGLFKTTNGGETWNRIEVGMNDEKNSYGMIKAAKSNSSLLYTFGTNMENTTTNIGFIKSMDGGSTWESFAPSLKNHDICYFDVSSDGTVIYAIANDVSKIFKSVDGGDSWSEHNINSSGYTITISPSDPDRVLFGKSDGLYLSTNGLKTSIKVSDIGTSVRGFGHVCDVAFSQSDNNIVYMISLGYNVYKSTDAGQTFTKIVNLRDDVLNVLD